MLAKIETMKCKQELTEAFRDLAIEERNSARRWSAAWKRAAKEYCHGFYMMKELWQDTEFERDSARQVARRLLRERDKNWNIYVNDIEYWKARVRTAENERNEARAERDKQKEISSYENTQKFKAYLEMAGYKRERDEARSSREAWHAVSIAIGNQRDEARANHESAENDLDNLAVKLSEARRNGIQLRETVETQTATIQHLESDRDALARELAVLTDLCTTIETERMNMRAHLVKMLETNLCPECHNPGYHADDCKLRVALGLAKEG